MPQFRYDVKKAPGELSSGVIDAESRRAAVSRLRDMGYFPIRIEPYEGGDREESIKRTFHRVRLKERNVFFRQLANLTEAGMPIVRALSTIIDQTENVKLAQVVGELRDDVQKGSSLAEAMERRPKYFPAVYCNLIRAGESGGMLDDVLWRLVEFGEQEEDVRGKAVSAMIYPAFLLIVGSVAIFILMSFVFPKFITIFEDFNATLPLPTRIVMGVCDFMGHFWWAVLVCLIGLIAALVAYRRTERGRKTIDLAALRFPVLGGVVQRYEMSIFARTLGTLLDNGVPVLTALQITADTISNTVIAEEVRSIHARVTEGDSISDSLGQCGHFPPMVVNMFAIGEETGRVGAITRRVADAYDTEVDRAVKAMAALFEPVLIVIMGVVIGFLVIAMLLPMLTLSANVG